MRETSTFKIRRDSVISGSLVEIVELPKLEDLVKPEELVLEEEHSPGSKEDLLDEKKAQMQELLEKLQVELDLAKKNIEECEQKAQEIIEEAKVQGQSEADQIREEATKEGLAKAQDEIEKLKADEEARFQKFIDEINRTCQTQNERVQSGILSVAVEIAKKVIDVEYDKNDAVFMNLIKGTAAILRQDKKRIMRISVEDYKRFFSVGNEKQIHDLQAMGIDVVRDVLLEKGDCVLETGYGNVNTGITKQLKMIEDNLREEL